MAEKFSLPYLSEKMENLGHPYSTDLALKRELKEKFGDLLKEYELTKTLS